MRMIKFKLLGVLATMLLGATASFGQSVYYDTNEGGVVIDCTMMPEGTVLALDDSHENEEDDHQLPSSTTDNHNSDTNKVYPKLVVAMEDLSDNKLRWHDAVDAAKDYGTSHTDWRLPNQRELMLISILREEIKRAGGVSYNPVLSENYWSATPRFGDSYWIVKLYDGYTNFSKSTSYYYARAVREIHPQSAD